MEDTAITHLSFSREYTAAVEAKQVHYRGAVRQRSVSAALQYLNKSWLSTRLAQRGVIS